MNSLVSKRKKNLRDKKKKKITSLIFSQNNLKRKKKSKRLIMSLMPGQENYSMNWIEGGKKQMRSSKIALLSLASVI